MSSKLITVYGATGSQGGSVINSILENKSEGFKVRGITRNPDSEKAKALAARGVEVVKADGLVKEQMFDAFKDSWAVFLNTISADAALHKPGAPSESDHGKELVDVAFEAGVEVLIYSSTASPKVITGGAVRSPEMDEKYIINEYAKTKGFKTLVTVAAGWYIDNHFYPKVASFLGGFPFTADEDGFYTLAMPTWGAENKIPFVSISDDFGDVVHGVLLDPAAYDGHFIQVISDLATPDQLTAAVEKASGRRSRYVENNDWKSLEAHGDGELETSKGLLGFCHITDGHYFGVANDMTQSRKLKAAAITARGRSVDENGLIALSDYVKGISLP